MIFYGYSSFANLVFSDLIDAWAWRPRQGNVRLATLSRTSATGTLVSVISISGAVGVLIASEASFDWCYRRSILVMSSMSNTI